MFSRDYGFSLLELLMTIAVAALILMLGLPSFAVEDFPDNFTDDSVRGFSAVLPRLYPGRQGNHRRLLDSGTRSSAFKDGKSFEHLFQGYGSADAGAADDIAVVPGTLSNSGDKPGRFFFG